MRKVRLAKARSRAGSSVALVPPIGSTARTSAPRMFPCCLRTPPRARIRRRWSARARSARSSPPSRPSGGCFWRKRPAFPGLHARRKDAEQKLRATEANLARLGELLSDQEQRASQLRRQARAAERYRQLSDKIRVGRGAAGSRPLGRGRSGRNRGQAGGEDRRNRCHVAAGRDGQCAAGAGPCGGASRTTAQ